MEGNLAGEWNKSKGIPMTDKSDVQMLVEEMMAFGLAQR